MSLVLGIDGGGTKTRVAIAEGESVIAHVEGGSIKRLRVGAEAAEENLRVALKEIFAIAGKVQIEAATVGVASASMPGVHEWIKAVFSDFGVTNVEVVGDHIIALDAAFHGGAGILQIAGTGSNCIGRTADGAFETAGGWSSHLGDEGSGYWIGLHAVRRALTAYDREEKCGILEAVGKAWGTKGIDELVNVGDGTPGPDFAALAPIIDELAEAGDAVALGVLKQAAEDLVNFVLLVREKLRRKHGLTVEVPVAWTGSVIGKMRLVRETFERGLKEAAPEMPVGSEEVVSIEGAIWRATCGGAGGAVGAKANA